MCCRKRRKTRKNAKKTRKNNMVDVQQIPCKKRYYGATPSFSISRVPTPWFCTVVTGQKAGLVPLVGWLVGTVVRTANADQEYRLGAQNPIPMVLAWL
jgi:hypothetical protein